MACHHGHRAECSGLTKAKAKRPLKRRLRLLYSGVGLDLELSSTTLGRLLEALKASKSAAPRTAITKVSGRRPRAASAMAFALRGPVCIRQA
jgi:hypothetical protein